MATFQEIWDSPIGTTVQVSNGMPPPSKPEGVAHAAWRSHNFTGTLEEKIDRNGWRYLKLEVLSDTTPEEVEYLAYEIPEGPMHFFEIL